MNSITVTVHDYSDSAFNPNRARMPKQPIECTVTPIPAHTAGVLSFVRLVLRRHARACRAREALRSFDPDSAGAVSSTLDLCLNASVAAANPTSDTRELATTAKSK